MLIDILNLEHAGILFEADGGENEDSGECLADAVLEGLVVGIDHPEFGVILVLLQVADVDQQSGECGFGHVGEQTLGVRGDHLLNAESHVLDGRDGLLLGRSVLVAQPRLLLILHLVQQLLHVVLVFFLLSHLLSYAEALVRLFLLARSSRHQLTVFRYLNTCDSGAFLLFGERLFFDGHVLPYSLLQLLGLQLGLFVGQLGLVVFRLLN